MLLQVLTRRAATCSNLITKPTLRITSQPWQTKSRIRVFTSTSERLRANLEANKAHDGKPREPQVGAEALDAKGKVAQKNKPLVIPAAPKRKDPLAVDNKTDKEQRKADWDTIRQMAHYLWPKNALEIKVRVVTAVALLIGGKILNVQVPFYFKSIVDSMNVDFVAIGGTAWTVGGSMILAYGLARVGAAVFSELRNAVFASVGQKAIRRVAGNVFDHLLRLDLNFHLTKQTGGLTKAIDRGTKGISSVLTAMVFHVVPTALEISMVCGILTYQYGANFAMITVGTMVAYSVFTVRTTAWRTKFRRQVNEADQKAGTVATDALLNYEAVKYFNNEKYEVGRYDKALQDYEKSSVKQATSLAFLNSGQNFIFSSALTAMMYLGANGIATGAMSVGDLVMINQLVFQLSLPLNFLGSMYRDLRQALLDMETLSNLQKTNIAIKEIPEAPPLLLSRGGEITFENVTFGYDKDRPILKNMNLTIPAGKKVAIVGSSGCGKSTILRLLFRFYDVQEGRILIDGQDITKVNLDSLRKAIGVVPQDTPLFNDTILHNIQYGNMEASHDAVVAAAKRAQIHDHIQSLKLGYNTLVGERGLMISGGEKQRLAVARLVLKGAPLAFFDEATSALDTDTEMRVMGEIKTLLREEGAGGGRKTSVFVAHRLRTIYDSDVIVVLKDGRVAEMGTHSRLIDSGGVYSELWSAQETLFTDVVEQHENTSVISENPVDEHKDRQNM